MSEHLINRINTKIKSEINKIPCGNSKGAVGFSALLWLPLMLLIAAITGCSTHKEQLLPHGNQSMMEVWNRGAGGSVHLGVQTWQLMDARQVLRRPLTEQDSHALAQNQMSYTRTAQNEIYSQFHRLPNPDLVMYIFPHLAGSDPVPVPGYSTVFPLYQRVQYAMPGERTEPY